MVSFELANLQSLPWRHFFGARSISVRWVGMIGCDWFHWRCFVTLNRTPPTPVEFAGSFRQRSTRASESSVLRATSISYSLIPLFHVKNKNQRISLEHEDRANDAIIEQAVNYTHKWCKRHGTCKGLFSVLNCNFKRNSV